MQTIDTHTARKIVGLTEDQWRAHHDIQRGPIPLKRGGKGGPALFGIEELILFLYKSLPTDRFCHVHELKIRQSASDPLAA